MTVLVTRIAALGEVLFAALMGAVALGIPLSPTADEQSALLMVLVQAGLAVLAATGLFRRTWWGWLAALGVIALVFAPLAIASYRAWRDGIGVGVSMPAQALRLVAVAWVVQLVVAVCFLVVQGTRLSTPRI